LGKNMQGFTSSADESRRLQRFEPSYSRKAALGISVGLVLQVAGMLIKDQRPDMALWVGWGKDCRRIGSCERRGPAIGDRSVDGTKTVCKQMRKVFS
jgi:hypothetical protein